MFKNYFKTATRNLLNNKGYSMINIGGLAIGMTVAMFIGLWTYDELSFNKYHENYNFLGQIYKGQTDPLTGEISNGPALQMPVGATLRNNYPQYFKHVAMAWWIGDYHVSSGEEKFTRKGLFVEPQGLEMFSVKMLRGNYQSIDKQNSVVISQSFAKAIFGEADPVGKPLQLDDRMDVEITGVYEDIPRNNKLGEVKFFAPWSLFLSSRRWLWGKEADWDNHMTNTYVQLQPNTSFEAVNAAIADMFSKNMPADYYSIVKKNNPYVQVFPMSAWHLYSEFKDGKPTTGRIVFVWLFGTVGLFVLLLACINFVNLSTARSEKRAREVGVRKTMGSARRQLIMQFLSESFLVVVIAFAVAVLLLVSLQPAFNQLANKEIALPFSNPVFWLVAAGFITFTSILAGTYPAFYLSSFQPAKVLKGVLRLGRFGTLPRKVLVVIQFTVSVVLIIGTLVVYNQIDFARKRPVGYNRGGLISMDLGDPAIRNKVNTFRTELLATGVVSEAATSSQPLTALWNTTGGYDWPGRDQNFDAEFADVNVALEFGRAIGWEIVAGRDFSPEFATDSTDAIILNESAIRYMGLKDPIGKVFVNIDDLSKPKWSKTIIGVVRDVIVESPYEPVMQTMYYYDADQNDNVLHIRINPSVSVAEALPKIKQAFEKVAPGSVFGYGFVDDVYATKFSQEERVGRLAAVFSALAIFISCLGLFGLASFVAEQRTKEIGIRKVMGASVAVLWRMLSKDFIVLIVISCVVAIPIGYYLMDRWLNEFQYRTDVSWSVFAITCASAIIITLLTVSYQSLKAASMNPVKSLRSE